ncbi:hypothetical protein EVJ58_g10780 [Rhodofomes roseus]|uniref:Uncharacterized protein n=1 Tax=Rhodofomes roseus TaxID=34475 RepID=A0A4Y9XLS9_9APHY|nr:hypothetical protein EVJ58_g10780 [Rhodofomes roseus]
MAAVRRQLAEEESVQPLPQDDASSLLKTSPSVMIAGGVDLEDQLWRLRYEAKKLGEHSTDKQRATVTERLNVMRRRLEAWFNVQQAYIAGAQSLREARLHAAARGKDVAAYDIPLLLPSDVVHALSVDPALQDCEWRLRYAQAHDALNDLRRHLRLSSHLYHFKDRFVRGQRENTRARSIIKTVQDKVDEDAARYCRARTALLTLSQALGKTGWQDTLKDLADDDVRLMSAGLEGESPEDAHNPELQEALRIEWCQSRARAQRWLEEIELILEEMRRVVQYHGWKHHSWTARADARPDLDDDYREGLSAYAHRQAEIRVTMCGTCTRAWRCVSELVSKGLSMTDGEDDGPAAPAGADSLNAGSSAAHGDDDERAAGASD